MQAGLAHCPVSCWVDCSFQSNTADDRGESAMPIRVPRENKKRRRMWWRERKQREVVRIQATSECKAKSPHVLNADGTSSKAIGPTLSLTPLRMLVNNTSVRFPITPSNQHPVNRKDQLRSNSSPVWLLN